MSKPVVLLYEPIHQDALDLLEHQADVRWAEDLTEETLLKQVADVDGIIIRANGAVTRRLMEAAPRLKVVGRHGVGLETIDLQAAADLSVVVVNTPHANTESVAEHCLGMMIALAKHMRQADKALRAGDWHARYRFVGSELRGKVLGIIGFGEIGRRLATICRRGLSMSILYHDVEEYPDAAAELDARRVPLTELLDTADVVSVHVPLLPETRGLIGQPELTRMKTDAYLINSSRGPVVDQAALVRALREEQIAGAGLDVYDPEPLPAGADLLDLDSVIVTPHMAAHTDEALLRMAMVVTDVLAVIGGRPPKHPVPLPG
jgi:D-3-phosphoglycerate dehydrogenase